MSRRVSDVALMPGSWGWLFLLDWISGEYDGFGDAPVEAPDTRDPDSKRINTIDDLVAFGKDE